MRTVTSGIGGVIPLIRRSSNGTVTLVRLLVQYRLIWRYSIFFVPATISASHCRFMVVVIRSNCISFDPLPWTVNHGPRAHSLSPKTGTSLHQSWAIDQARIQAYVCAQGGLTP